MKDNRTPKTYFQPNQAVKNTAIRMADSRDIVESILKGDLEGTKGLVANSILQRLEKNTTFHQARRRGGNDIENQLFN